MKRFSQGRKAAALKKHRYSDELKAYLLHRGPSDIETQPGTRPGELRVIVTRVELTRKGDHFEATLFSYGAPILYLGPYHLGDGDTFRLNLERCPYPHLITLD